jgi:hypothetical protein
MKKWNYGSIHRITWKTLWVFNFFIQYYVEFLFSSCSIDVPILSYRQIFRVSDFGAGETISYLPAIWCTTGYSQYHTYFSHGWLQCHSMMKISGQFHMNKELHLNMKYLFHWSKRIRCEVFNRSGSFWWWIFQSHHWSANSIIHKSDESQWFWAEQTKNRSCLEKWNILFENCRWLCFSLIVMRWDENSTFLFYVFNNFDYPDYSDSNHRQWLPTWCRFLLISS